MTLPFRIQPAAVLAASAFLRYVVGMRAALTLDDKLDLLIGLAMGDRDGAGGPGGDASTVAPPRLRHARSTGALGPLNLRNVRVGSGQRRATLLRVLMTNACSFNCHYCPMRRDRDMPRTLLKPSELVRIFLAARERGWCDGLFITTGIPGRPSQVMNELIEVLELLRFKHRFTGYVHVKLVIGAESAQVERVAELATRVSVNLETPCGASLAPIAPEKRFDDALVTLERARSVVKRTRAELADGRPADPLRPGAAAGLTMQLVVGASPDSDRDILTVVHSLASGGGVHHPHFSAFRPIADTPMESVRETPVLREHRLYQADWLVRRYGFAGDELVFGEDGNLPLNHDPKVAWALAHPEHFPVDVLRAPLETLLRVPGIGPTSARRICRTRRDTPPRTLADLRRMGVVAERASGFLMLRGRQLREERWQEQLTLWPAGSDAGVPARTYAFSPGTFR